MKTLLLIFLSLTSLAQKSKRDVLVFKGDMDVLIIGINDDIFIPDAKVICGVYFDTVFFVINNDHHNWYSPVKINRENKKVVQKITNWVDKHSKSGERCILKQNSFGELTAIHLVYSNKGYIVFVNTVGQDNPHYVFKYPSIKSP